jgi:hypothetical protein
MATQPTSLEKEFGFFEQHRAEWAQQHQGEFVLVFDGQEAGFYGDYETAFLAGLRQFGMHSKFLVKQVCVVEPVFYIY